MSRKGNDNMFLSWDEISASQQKAKGHQGQDTVGSRAVSDAPSRVQKQNGNHRKAKQTDTQGRQVAYAKKVKVMPNVSEHDGRQQGDNKGQRQRDGRMQPQIDPYEAWYSAGNTQEYAAQGFINVADASMKAVDKGNDGKGSKKKRKDKGKRHHRGLKAVSIVMICMLVLASGAFAWWYTHLANELNDSNVITNELKSELKETQISGEPFYMLLLGTDGREGEESYRSDTIMLTRIDPTDKRVTIVSIPRDTMVEINGQRQKINAAYVIGGPAGAVKAVSTLCGVDISHYAEVAFGDMQNLVDAVGGVDLDVEQRIYDPDHFGKDMVLEPGEQHLDGEHAMFYARSRNFPDGDYARTRHQRQLVVALATEALQNTDATTIVPFVESLADMVTTDLSIPDIVSIANSLRGIDTETGIYTCTVPSTTDMLDGVSYVIADMDGLKAIMDNVDVGNDPDGPDTMDEGLTANIEDLQNQAQDGENGNGNVSIDSDYGYAANSGTNTSRGTNGKSKSIGNSNGNGNTN